jgi:hypothetical protein
MPDEKDRLGDMLQKKERGEEERYFAEQDRLRLAKLRARGAAAEQTPRPGACPRCGRTLVVPVGRPPAGDECDGGCPQP